jgi:PIN domain-containing protein
MAIYLDANILWGWRAFDEVERLALSIVAHQIGQTVFVPRVAAREAEGTYRRSLERAIERHDGAVRELQRQFRTAFFVDVEPQPWIPDAIDAWKAGLAGLAEVIPTEPVDAVEALEREIVGDPPTKKRAKDKPEKPGEGARDAAIWLTVLRHHKSTGEPGAFITTNSDDFAESGELKPALAAELEGYDHPLTLYLSVGEFIDSLGQPTEGPEIGLDELRELAEPTLKEALKHRPDVPRTYWDQLEPELRYATEIDSARPTRIRAQHRYERPDEAVSVVDADWKLTVTARFQDIDMETPNVWGRLQGPLDMTARIQVFVPERDGTRERAQFITAGRWSSQTTLYLTESGEIRSIEIGPVSD